MSIVYKFVCLDSLAFVVANLLAANGKTNAFLGAVNGSKHSHYWPSTSGALGLGVIQQFSRYIGMWPGVC